MEYKYILIGPHSSGKREVLSVCRSMGLRVGSQFVVPGDIPDEIYQDEDADVYTFKEVSNIYTQGAYLCMSSGGIVPAGEIYRGISLYEFDNNDVFYITPDQLPSLNKTVLNKYNIVWIWLDNTRVKRENYHKSNDFYYDFAAQERNEAMDDFPSLLYSYGYPVLYFSGDIPERIATVIYTLVKYPSLLEIYIKNYSE